MKIKEYSFLDISQPKIVQVEINPSGSILWVNIDGLCMLRVCVIERLDVIDNRKEKKS